MAECGDLDRMDDQVYSDLYLQGQGGDAMALIEAAAVKQPTHVATPGDTTMPVQTGQLNVSMPAAKATRVVRAAELSGKTYLESEADVDVYVAKLKAELMSLIYAGQKARVL